MDRVNPVYIPRNHRVEEALTAATAGDLGPFRTLLDVVARPFTPRPGLADYTGPGDGTPTSPTAAPDAPCCPGDDAAGAARRHAAAARPTGLRGAGLVAAAPVPVRLARGELDPMVTTGQLAELVSDPVVLAGLGHNAHVERPDALRPLILSPGPGA